MVDIECVFQSMTGRGAIYISNIQAAQSIPLLHNKNIKAILSVARSGLLRHSKEDIPHYLYIPAEDHEDYHLYQYFEETFNFIEKARKQTNVLVHCMVGVSRSVTIVIAYLLKKYKYSLPQKKTKSKSFYIKINPNRGFIQQLKKYAESFGLKCDLTIDFMQYLKQQSLSKHRRTFSSAKSKSMPKKVEAVVPIVQPPPIELDLQKIIQKSNNKEDYFRQDFNRNRLQPRKGRSFIESQIMNNMEEQDNNNQKLLVELNNFDQKLQMKKSISIPEEKQVRRLSIQEKISKIRDKILKKEVENKTRYLGKNNVNTPLTATVTPKKKDNSLDREHHTTKNQEPQTAISRISYTPMPNFHHQNEINRQSKLSPPKQKSNHFPPKFETNQKEIIPLQLKLDASNLFSSRKTHKRVDTRITQQYCY